MVISDIIPQHLESCSRREQFFLLCFFFKFVFKLTQYVISKDFPKPFMLTVLFCGILL